MQSFLDHRSPRRRVGIIAVLLLLGASVASAQNPFANWGAAGKAMQEMQQGVALVQQSRGAEGLPYLYRAAETFRERGDPDNLGQCLYWIGSTHFGLRQYAEAVSALDEAVELAREADNPSLLAPSLVYLGSSYWAQGERSLGLDYLRTGIDYARDIRDTGTQGLGLLLLSNSHLFAGDYGEALESHEAGLQLAEQLGDDMLGTVFSGGLAVTYSSLGQEDKALEYAQRALSRVRASPDRAMEVHYSSVLAANYRKAGRLDESLGLLERSLQMAQQIDDDRALSSALLQLGETQRKLGKTDEALQSFQQSVTIDRNMPEAGTEIAPLTRIGLLHLQTGRYDEAFAVLSEAATLAARHEEPVAGAKIANGLARTEVARGNLPEAERHLQTALAVYASQGVRKLSDQQRLGLFQEQQETYALLQDVLIRQDKHRDALAIAEQGRARALTILLSERLSEDERSRLAGSTITVEDIEETARRLGAVLVEYSVFGVDGFDESRLFIWVVSPDGGIEFRSVEFDVASRSLASLVRGARSAIGVRGLFGTGSDRGSGDDAADNASDLDSLQRLHAELIDPIAELLPVDTDVPVMFLPHAELFMVPFAALQDSNGRYLVEKHTLVSAPSVQVARYASQASGGASDRQVLIVGDPKMPDLPPQFGDAYLDQLPGTAAEARRIAELFETEALIGAEASETDIAERMAGARIIHLATHGLLDDFGSGIPGAIALAPSADDDGLLTAMEIFQMRLNADLVVLSACDTGLGRITGDGVVGLSRSLIAAGAASAVVSLWQVPDDPTAMLMIAFYENLTSGMNKAQALRHAMLSTKEKHPDPYNWAAFTLVGAID